MEKRKVVVGADNNTAMRWYGRDSFEEEPWFYLWYEERAYLNATNVDPVYILNAHLNTPKWKNEK